MPIIWRGGVHGSTAWNSGLFFDTWALLGLEYGTLAATGRYIDLAGFKGFGRLFSQSDGGTHAVPAGALGLWVGRWRA